MVICNFIDDLSYNLSVYGDFLLVKTIKHASGYNKAKVLCN